MVKKYCYKIKRNYLKRKPNNAYSKAKIESYGFLPYTSEDEEDTEIIFAKSLKLSVDSSIAQWMKHDLEKIHNKGDEKWLKELENSGYEFDEEGHLIYTEAFLSGLNVQLCISNQRPYNGCLFINVGGTTEFYEKDTLDECAASDMILLLSNDVAYKKILVEEE